MKYIEVILPLALDSLYHYRLSEFAHTDDSSSLIGRRVVVSFGAKRFYTGIISACADVLPHDVNEAKLKPIEYILDDQPIVTPRQLSLWHWVADYYCCTIGQVMRVALPGGLLPESRTIVSIIPDFTPREPLTPDEEILLDILKHASGQGLTMEAIRHRMGSKSTRVFTRLISLGALHTEETIISRYQPRLKAYITLTAELRTHSALKEVMDMLRRAVRQREIFSEFLDLLDSTHQGLDGRIARIDLTYGDTQRATMVRKLVERGIWQLEELEDSRICPDRLVDLSSDLPIDAPALPNGVSVLNTENVRMKEKTITALVGNVIRSGGQVLLLSPTAFDTPSAESYLTKLSEASLQQVYYYHPMVSEAKRTELYRHLSTDSSPCLVIGTRQAVFLPMNSLRLIIVDEEQEYMYKQQYTPPYYHARDIALYIGSTYNIPVLLASETPSAETLFNMLRGKYYTLPAEDYTPPKQIDLEVLDLSKLREEGKLSYGRSISPPLVEAIKATLLRRERVLLLQNRRGYAPYIICDQCSARINCPHCDVSLNYYQSERLLRCHYCGYTALKPNACPSCGAHQISHRGQLYPALRLVGYGTERIEEEVQSLFPKARVLRIDSESLQSTQRITRVHERIMAGNVDIIVGTQLIKGQPIWDNIGLIAVIQLDFMLAFSDFRAEERTYQLLHQLQIRALSSEVLPRLIIQSSNPRHPFISALDRHDYPAFIQQQLALRQTFRFPPFVRLSYIRIKARDEILVDQIARVLYLMLARETDIHPSEPQRPSIARIDMLYIREITVRRPYTISYRNEREAMRRVLSDLQIQYPEARRVCISVDIDPL